MPVILCQNVRLDQEGSRSPCGRYLAELTELQIDILKIEPKKRSVFRCPLCPAEIRWVEIHWEGSPTNGELVFSTIENNGKSKFDKKDAVKFDRLEVYEQVG